MLGSTLAMKEGAHISVDFLTKKLNPNMHKIIVVFVDLSVTVFLLLVVRYGWAYAWIARFDHDPLVFHMNMAIPYASIPIGCLIMIIEFNIVTIIALLSDPEKDTV
jgi:C4-dicarboxylate transporter DctQ subunit